MLESANENIYDLRTTAPGPRGELPFAGEQLKTSPSGDIFGWTQNAGMGWDPQDMRRPNFLVLSTQGGIRRNDGSPIALGYHTGHWEVGLLMEKAAMAIAEKMLDYRSSDIQLLLGDFNAYKQEQPLQVLHRQGWRNAADLNTAPGFSYRFRGRLGSLDHILYQISGQSSQGLKPRQFVSWHINSTESEKTVSLAKGNKADTDLAPYLRSSDHDPQILTLSF